MANTVAFADVEQMLVDYLGVPEHIGTSIPNPRPDTFYRIERVGGPRRTRVTEQPLVVLEAWSVDEDAAYALMARGRTAMEALEGQSLIEGCPIYDMDENSGPTSLPDPLSTHCRYTATFEFSIRGVIT